jgi:hypothetical protein
MHESINEVTAKMSLESNTTMKKLSMLNIEIMCFIHLFPFTVLFTMTSSIMAEWCCY